jgi:hypothetical protein
MNGSWLDVLGVVLPAPYSVHPCQHVEASYLEVNPFITLLPILNVLILNRGIWSDCVNIFVHLVWSWSSLFTVCFGLRWLVLSFFTTGYFGSTPCYSWHLAGLCSVSGCPATDSPSSRSWERVGLIFAFSFTFSFELRTWFRTDSDFIWLLPFRKYVLFLVEFLWFLLLDCASCLPMHLGYLLDC